jgi:hypothetical protein
LEGGDLKASATTATTIAATTTQELLDEIEEVKAAIKEVLDREQMNEKGQLDMMAHKKRTLANIPVTCHVHSMTFSNRRDFRIHVKNQHH